VSGPAGTALGPIVAGAQVWVKWVNTKGGLNGHSVRLLIYDDGGDPARHRAQVQEAIEQRGAVAFLANAEVITGRQSVEYITAKGVPVVGTDGGELWAYDSPMYFPQGATGPALYQVFAASVAHYMAPKGKTKVGTLVCVEAQGCLDVERTFTESANEYGYQHVYKGRTSLAQPDFTAECLAARNAGVEALWVNLDQNSTKRVANACARQGYRPTFAIPGQGAVEDMKDDPNLEGTLAPNGVFPWFQSGTPATDEYRNAMEVHGKGIPPGGGPPWGWTAGKLLETAAAQLPEPPTSAAILTSLWAIKANTLGGITGPLTYTKDKPPPHLVCWFDHVIQNRSWNSPDGFKVNCR
jgi:branched-chain amino acid transport system substrate-binding protein